MTKQHYDVGHTIADCMDCGAHFEGRHARQSAKRHSENKGHRVTGETTRTWRYTDGDQS